MTTNDQERIDEIVLDLMNLGAALSMEPCKSFVGSGVGVCLKAQARINRVCAENERLRTAFLDCLSYIDVDNLTMQTKDRNWRKVLAGGEWDKSNVKIN
jgi:hypothetical protein